MYVAQFTDLTLANSFADRCKKMHVVMLGTDGYFWVCTMAQISTNERSGIEYAN